MYPRVAQRSSLRIVIALTVCTALLSISSVRLLVTGAAQGPRQERKAKPKPGKPEGVLPDLEDVKKQSEIEREAPPPIPSTIRAKKNISKPWDGRRVGDPEPARDHANRIERGSARSEFASNTKPITERPSNQTRRAHARSRMVPPPVTDDQFVQNFFTWAVARNPFGNETIYWYDQLRVAHANSQTSLKLAAIELGRTLFESAEYAARNRDNHWYVYDLYKTYLMRDPDPSGWAFWESQVPPNERVSVRRAFEESGEFATIMANLTLSGSASSNAASLISAQVEPRNQPSRGMLTRDTNWSVPLLSLPGRAGLDLGLALSYSSMVWTRSGPYLYFDEDNGFPSPGFRLGFPSVQRKVFDAQTAKNAYLLITATGHRVELRQVGTSNIHDAADSSYLRLTDEGAVLRAHSTDGTRLSFTETNGEYRCIEIKDRNGNYITVNYNVLGQIATITDTLGRVITFNYDGNANLLSITQAWNGQPSHQWVSFGWGTRTMQSSFSDGTLRGIVGTANGTVLPVITQVALNDTSHFTFDYTNSLQVSAVRNYFGALERNATIFTYETPAGDAPRLLDSRVSARNWTGINGVPSQVITQYSVAADGACMLTAPDGTIYKEYYGTGWQKGLTILSEVWSGGQKIKWTTTSWTQDNTNPGVSYEVNPRVLETNVYDISGNRRRTLIDYGEYAQYGLPYMVREYAADALTPIRETFTDYHLSQAYLERRIIGLIHQVHLTNGSQYQSKITYDYDDPTRLQAVPAAATQHDTNYNTSFTARGNVTAVSRWDVTDINNAAKKLTTHTNYYNTGAPSSTTDPAYHQSSIIYTDSFSDSVNRNTFAYPTTITDADGFSSTVQYNYDFAAITRTQSASPAGQSQGAIQTMTYNSLGQLDRITTTNNGAYKRFWYGADFTASYATVNNVADELYSIQVTDGLSRIIGAAGNHPGSSGGYRLVNTIYDLMGRTWKQSNPTEVNSSWVPSGDDVSGIYYTQQTYDWQGRPLVTTHPDLTTKEASYAGCGCAGGEVVTFTDEGTVINFAGTIKKRQKKIYSDVLGRTWKVELLNWDGIGPNGTAPNNTAYSTTVNTYNARDQLTQIRQYAGSEGSGTFQDTAMSYDGYGRLASKHIPEQSPGTATVYAYNADDTILSVTDARGASATHNYNNRHLLTAITYNAPGGITPTASATFGYDAAGNRISMTDGLGTKAYNFDQLSRLMSETRTFTGVGTFTLSYDYNLAGQLKKITDASNTTINYGYDVAGQLTGVTGSDTLVAGVSTYASGFQYRAWGGLKQVSVGTLSSSFGYNSRVQTSNFNISGVVNENYSYHYDGRLRFVYNTTDNNFDRALFYDHVGRLTLAAAGGEARQDLGPVPFLETFGYNAFNDLSQRETESWHDSYYSDAGTFINHRRTDWGYDASGRITTIDTRTYTYDAAGRNITLTGQRWTPSGYVPTSTESGFDGDGNRVRENSGSSGSMTLRYYLQSSVLGGAVIEELNSSGQKQTGYVYTPSGTQLATQTIGQNLVKFKQTSPLQTTERSAFTTGSTSRIEFDPVGAKIRNFPLTPPDRGDDPGDIPGDGGGSLDSRFSALGNPAAGCTLDGVYMPCYIAMRGRGTASDVIYVDQFYAIAARTSSRTPVWVEEDTSTAVRTGDNELTIYPGPGGHYEWVDDPDDVLEVFTRPASPQNPERQIVPLGNLRKNLERLLKGDCGVFVQNLIDKANLLFGGGKGHATSFWDAYSRIQDAGGYQLDDVAENGGTVRGELFVGELVNPSLPEGIQAGPGTVHIQAFGTFGRSARPAEVALNQARYAYTALHETLHLAKLGWYSDEELARAGHAVDGTTPPQYGKDAILGWSGNFDTVLQRHCAAQFK